MKSQGRRALIFTAGSGFLYMLTQKFPFSDKLLEFTGGKTLVSRVYFPDGKQLSDFKKDRSQWIDPSAFARVFEEYRNKGLIRTHSHVKAAHFYELQVTFSSPKALESYVRAIRTVANLDSLKRQRLGYRCVAQVT